MSTNPFDEVGSSKDRVQGGNHLSLQEAQQAAKDSLKSCEQKRREHTQAWEQHKREAHARRLEVALEREAAEGGFIPSVVQRERDAEDDRRYAYLTDFDQLLELTAHGEYLRARRAWERRHQVEDVELNVKLAVEVSGERSLPKLSQIWATFAAIGILFVLLACLKESWLAVCLIPIAALAWVAISRLPVLYQGTFDGNHGARGPSGTVV
jgi:hypothetical protein